MSRTRRDEPAPEPVPEQEDDNYVFVSHAGVVRTGIVNNPPARGTARTFLPDDGAPAIDVSYVSGFQLFRYDPESLGTCTVTFTEIPPRIFPEVVRVIEEDDEVTIITLYDRTVIRKDAVVRWTTGAAL
jgi:hypothetical protein